MEDLTQRYSGESVKKNKYGFYQLNPIPTEEELGKYYAEKYYQNESVQYSHVYDASELEFIENKLHQKEVLIRRFVSTSKDKMRLFDLGCGEGFTLSYFYRNGYEVLGTDYSSYGIKTHNPDMLSFFMQGELLKVCDGLREKREKFDIVNLDNVLEHVPDPKLVLETCVGLLTERGIVVIEVPNDFNPVQMFLLKHKMIQSKNWVCAPDHISYFNREGLKALCESVSLAEDVVLGDQLIELFAFNPDSNYFDDSSKGHNCHIGRKAMEKCFEEISTNKVINLGIALGDMGIGRQLIGIYHKE